MDILSFSRSYSDVAVSPVRRRDTTVKPNVNDDNDNENGNKSSLASERKRHDEVATEKIKLLQHSLSQTRKRYWTPSLCSCF
jgi:hypothetical protein